MKKFKKAAAVFMATAMLAVSAGGMEAANVSADSTLYGDVNCNGTIELSDIIVLNKFLSGQEYLVNMDNADVNNNGIISDADYSILLDYRLGIITELPYDGN